MPEFYCHVILTIDKLFSGMHHYDTVEKFFRGWEKSNKNNKELLKYPDVTLVPPKDDIVEYTSHSVEDW